MAKKKACRCALCLMIEHEFGPRPHRRPYKECPQCNPWGPNYRPVLRRARHKGR